MNPPDKPFGTVCVMGLGYIGLPTASLLATRGFRVHGVDVNEQVVETINAGHIHIREPELDVLVNSAVQSGRLKASTEPTDADVFILAVPTPFMDGNKPDLSYVEAATRQIAKYLKGNELVILESTSPVGATEKVADWLAEERTDLVFPVPGATSGNGGVKVAHCPERVLPGQIIRELVSNDRIVGGLDAASTEAAANYYRQFVSGEILSTDSRTAELAKLAENTYRDVNIALANEFSMICDELNIDVSEVINLANHHPRVDILKPGPGVGGHCIAVDPWFIVDSAPETSRLIQMARSVNNAKPGYVVSRVLEAAEQLNDPVIACLGLAYKADIDDLRESPSVAITAELAKKHSGRVLAVEPHITALPDVLTKAGVELVPLDQAVTSADVIVGLVAHRVFRELVVTQLDGKLVVDCSNALPKATSNRSRLTTL